MSNKSKEVVIVSAIRTPIGNVKILKKTKTLIFLFCELKCNDKIITSASGVWKILKVKPVDLGPGG